MKKINLTLLVLLYVGIVVLCAVNRHPSHEGRTLRSQTVEGKMGSVFNPAVAPHRK